MFSTRLLIASALITAAGPFGAHCAGQVSADSAGVDVAYRGWGTWVEVGTGWPASLELLGQPLSGATVVGGLGVLRFGRLWRRIRYGLVVGGQLARRSGQLGERRYRARALRLGIEGSLGTQLPDPRYAVFAGLRTRNHLAYADFDIKRRDNLRFDLSLTAAYRVRSRAYLSAKLSRALRHRDDASYVTDPRHQLTVALAWVFASARS